VKVSVVVVAFAKEKLLEECLARLETALAHVDDETELIVVANQLSPVARERLRSRTLEVATVEGSPSLGFAGGLEAGLAVARGEWIACVNDDCWLEPDALAELLAAGERRSDVGSVAAQVRFAARPETINSAGLEIDDLGVARERMLGEPAMLDGAEVVDVFGASATLALYRRTMLDSLGGFDASFFAYLEDADLAWRARMAGWECVLAPRAVALHHHSATLGHGSNAKHLLVGRNRVRMLAKNGSGSFLRGRFIAIVAYDLLYASYVVATDRTLAPLRGRVRGLLDWRAYRRAGQPTRREIELSPSPGLREALRRGRIYRSARAGSPPAAGRAHDQRDGDGQPALARSAR
jgi:GT2 family glycosyltransferase